MHFPTRLYKVAPSLFFAAFLSSSAAHADSPIDPEATDWELERNKKNVEVYLKEIPGSSVKAFMGKATLRASIPSILKVMRAAETCPDWVEGCTTSETLEGARFAEYYQYGMNDLPWPASDRDYVIRVTTQEMSNGVLVNMTAVEGRVPPSDNIRLKTMNIQYHLTAMSPDRTAMVWVQHTEPEGDIPGWLINLLLVNIPVESMARLEKVASRPGFKDAAFIYNDQQEIIDVR